MSRTPAFDLVIPLIGFNPSGGVRMVIHVANAVAARWRRVAFVVPEGASVPPIELNANIETIIRGDATGLGDRVEFVHSLPPARAYLATGYQTPLLIALGKRRANPAARILHLVQADEVATHIRYGSQPGWIKPWLRFVARRGLAINATRIAVSSAVADAVGRNRIDRIVNPGIEARYIQRATDGRTGRSRRTDDSSRVTVGFFAQAGRVKGTAVALEALEHLPAPLDSMRFVAFDRGAAPALPEFVERFSVVQAERPLDLMAFYTTCDVFVFPSLLEGFGLPPLEAMACGAAAVISDCGGVREYAKDGMNCLLVPPGDARALAAAIERIATDAALRLSLVAAGRDTAIEFPVERFASACADEVDRLLG